MIIFLTNDDGINAKQINIMINKLQKIGEIYGVFPERERSGGSHAITLHKPLRANKVISQDKVKIWSSNGTPADCVLLGLFALLPERPNIVISGINRGYNLGCDIIYSGTVAGAREAALHDIPSIAISVPHNADVEDFEYATDFLLKMIPNFIKIIPPSVFLNINIPPTKDRDNIDLEFTFQGKMHYKNIIEKRIDPRAQEYFWVHGEAELEDEEGSDIWAIKRGNISITPLQSNMTDYSFLKYLKDNFPYK